MVTYENIEKANNTIKTTPLKHRDKDTGEIKINQYAEVAQRIKAFRMCYPQGFIIPEMVSHENGVCLIRATVGFYAENGDPITLAIGTAREKENTSVVNRTSYIENCETSAVGRALGMAGFGVDVALASAEDITKAQEEEQTNGENTPKNITERKASEKQVSILKERYTGNNLKKLLERNNIETLEDMPLEKASELIEKLTRKENNNGTLL